MSTRIDERLISKITALLHLADDETPLVRDAVTRELLASEMDVTEFIYEQKVSITDAQWRALNTIFLEDIRRKVLNGWEAWLECAEGPEKLERALELIVEFQNGTRRPSPVAEELNAMAALFLEQERPPNPRELASFMFDELGFTTAGEGTENSATATLSEVIAYRHGASILLICIYILLAHRLGLTVNGCNWPGSFYARFSESGVLHLVDFHNRGAVTTAEEMLRLQGPSREAAEAVVTLEMTTDMLVRRLLSHLAFYYRREGNTQNSLVMLELLRRLDGKVRGGLAGSAAS